jgi:ERCC4-related helicase
MCMYSCSSFLCPFIDLDLYRRTIATYQTLLQPLRLAKFDPRLLKAIVIDEAHHAASPSYTFCSPRSIIVSNFSIA